MTESYSTTVDGAELVAEQIEDGWRVRFGSKVVEAEFIDHALAQAIGCGPDRALQVLQRLFPPETE